MFCGTSPDRTVRAPFYVTATTACCEFPMPDRQGNRIERQGLFCRRQGLFRASQGSFTLHARSKVGKGGQGDAIAAACASLTVPTAERAAPQPDFASAALEAEVTP
jgi:hypothetical protein